MLKPGLNSFSSRDEASRAAADFAARLLGEAVDANGQASFLTSGGTSPKMLLEALSHADLDWSRISIGLVDERNVPEDHASSNASLVRASLLRNKAAAARFEPLYRGADEAGANAMQSDALYAMMLPADLILLGMGTDGHTASWFPGAANLEEAFRSSGHNVVAIDAAGCPVAGDITDRITLTRSAVAGARAALLLIFGEDKRDVLDAARSVSMDDMPVRAAIDDLADKLVIVWAP